jgi:LacI family transcriptional regulator
MLPGMDWARFSVVGWGESLLGSCVVPLTFVRAGVDHFGSVLRAWDEVWKRGYRRIGFVLLPLRPGSQDDQIRWAASQSCMLRIAPRERVPTLLCTTEKEQGKVTELKKWVNRYRLDAVIGFGSFFLRLLGREGFRVPRDLGFASLHVLEKPEPIGALAIKLAGMKDIRMESMMAAVESLDQQIRHHQYGLPQQPRTIMIHSEWIDGETLPPRLA